jgi:hypothetical protein
MSAELIRGMVCGLSPADRAQYWLAMLHAFLDDSGNSPNDPVFVLGGFISTADLWLDFSAEWTETRQKAISIAYFKSSEASSARDEFHIGRGWNRDLINERVESLARVVQRYALFRVSCSMTRADYNAFLKRFGDALRDPFHHFASSPYFFCLSALIVRVRGYCDANHIDPVCKYVLDTHGATGTFSAELLRHSNIPQIAAALDGSVPSFESDKVMQPLQAADLYAYQKHDWAVTGGKSRYQRVRETLEAIPAIEMTLDMRYLPALAERLDKSMVAAPQFLGPRRKRTKRGKNLA